MNLVQTRQSLTQDITSSALVQLGVDDPNARLGAGGGAPMLYSTTPNPEP